MTMPEELEPQAYRVSPPSFDRCEACLAEKEVPIFVRLGWHDGFICDDCAAKLADGLATARKPAGEAGP